MNEELRVFVCRRAGNACEYCLLPQSAAAIAFEVDHIIPRKHGGATEAQNLALACVYCNGFKGPNIAGIDPLNGAGAFLFNPRSDRWATHFRWAGHVIDGITPTGRAAVSTLRMNNTAALELRASLAAEGLMRFGE